MTKRVAITTKKGYQKDNNISMQSDSETEPEADPDAVIFEEPFPEYDVNDPQTRERLYTGPPRRKKPWPAKPPSNEIEATQALADFPASRSSVHDLRMLLEARADPNAIVGPGNISPLSNVMCFAHPCDVLPMRLLLLDHGAFESSAEKRRWAKRDW